MNPVDNYILNQPEGHKLIMLYMRSVLKKIVPEIEEKFSYRIPFYYYNNKPFCYFNVLKGTQYVDIGFMDGALFEQDFPELKNGRKRKRVRSLQVYNLEGFDEKIFVELLKRMTLYIDSNKTK